MKKLLTMGILGVVTIMGLSATALADHCVNENGNTGAPIYYQTPVQPVRAEFHGGWRHREALRLEALRREEIRREEIRRAEEARRAELARLERFRQMRVVQARWAFRHHPRPVFNRYYR